MPAWRAADTLADSVASVQAQSRTDWELVIIDDCSDDATLQIARGLAAADSRIVVIAQSPNGGAARARNRGIAAARGRHIAFLDADDLWLPQKLERQIAFMEQHGAALSYTGFLRVTAGTGQAGKPGAQRQVRIPPRVTYDGLLHGNVIGCSTAIYDSARLGKVLMPDIRLRQDYGLWLAILRRIPQAHGLPEALTIHQRRPGSLSAGFVRRTGGTWHLYREVEGLGRLQAAICLGAHLVNRIRAIY